MTWNYTKTCAVLSLAAILIGFVAKPMMGQIDAVLFMLPVAIIADVVSWLRRGRVTALPPE
jgi:hypothetical protein